MSSHESSNDLGPGMDVVSSDIDFSEAPPPAPTTPPAVAAPSNAVRERMGLDKKMLSFEDGLRGTVNVEHPEAREEIKQLSRRALAIHNGLKQFTEMSANVHNTLKDHHLKNVGLSPEDRAILETQFDQTIDAIETMRYKQVQQLLADLRRLKALDVEEITSQKGYRIRSLTISSTIDSMKRMLERSQERSS